MHLHTLLTALVFLVTSILAVPLDPTTDTSLAVPTAAPDVDMVNDASTLQANLDWDCGWLKLRNGNLHQLAGSEQGGCVNRMSGTFFNTYLPIAGKVHYRCRCVFYREPCNSDKPFITWRGWDGDEARISPGFVKGYWCKARESHLAARVDDTSLAMPTFSPDLDTSLAVPTLSLNLDDTSLAMPTLSPDLDDTSLAVPTSLDIVQDANTLVPSWDCGWVKLKNGALKQLAGDKQGACIPILGNETPIAGKVHDKCTCFFYLEPCTASKGYFAWQGWNGDEKRIQAAKIKGYWCRAK
ncbi:hypothetical protein BDV95DRAFT_620198 [Massariosphaeria phaeospora]|uniref:Uncharacterized protein n=1 Tax=Massariosphaeria phaeospora TaxID=100035 RepID=A0A7C8M7L3_9PLEO|nr:hypothetical protein BDV95DRAFT_620198 [Massariosphaeria phaeospora]